MNKAAQQAKQDTQPAPELRILKTGNCPSLSGKSKLTYHIGCTSEFEIQFRVFSNTGSGFFSNEWVSLNSILGVFDESNCIIDWRAESLLKSDTGQQGIHAHLPPQIREQIIDQAAAAAAKEICRQGWQC